MEYAGLALMNPTGLGQTHSAFFTESNQPRKAKSAEYA